MPWSTAPASWAGSLFQWGPLLEGERQMKSPAAAMSTSFCFPTTESWPQREPAVSCVPFEPLTFFNEVQDDPVLKLSGHVPECLAETLHSHSFNTD